MQKYMEIDLFNVESLKGILILFHFQLFYVSKANEKCPSICMSIYFNFKYLCTFIESVRNL
ncbi:hypothetical protein ACYT7O_10555, partial [Streptococcus pyogenes]